MLNDTLSDTHSPAGRIIMAAKPVAKSKAKAPSKGSANKTAPTKESVTAFLERLADADQKKDAKALIKMMKAATGKPPVMWGPSIVGFGKYHYKYDSGREGEMCRIGFSPRKGSTVIYMINGFADAPQLLAKLGKVKTGKSCLYIKRLSEIDMRVLDDMIARSVAYMDRKYP